MLVVEESHMVDQEPETESLEDWLPWIEFSAWTAVVLAPILTWLGGPSVSTDQAVMRTAVFVLAFGTAIVLRGRVILMARSKRGD